MAAFSLRDKWSYGAATGIALCLGLGGWAYKSMGSSRASVTPLRPNEAATSKTAPSTLDLPAGDTPPATVPSSTPVSAPATPVSDKNDKIVVHVAGSVKNPGVYILKPGDRINDAVKAAGGFKANAQQDALNLADTVRDADQIFVPAQVAPTAKTKVVSLAEPIYTTPRHPLIVHGTPGRIAMVSDAAATHPVQAAPASVPLAPVILKDSLPIAGDPPAEESVTPAVPVTAPGRVLGKPEPVAAEPNEPDGASMEAMATKNPAYLSASVRKNLSTHGTGSTRRTSGSASKSARGSGGSSAKFKNPGDGVVHLNSAGAAELEKIPGIGPAMSARILEYRSQIGSFRSVEQLMDVKGIGDKKLAKMLPFLTL